MSKVSKRRYLKIAGTTGVGMVAGCLGGNSGGSFPNEDVEILVPYSAGGGFDTYARLVAKYLPDELPNDVDVTVSNVTGGGGAIAVDQVYKDTGNGHKVLIIHIPSFIFDQVSRDDISYDLQEMTWYPQIANDPSAITVGQDTDVHSWQDFVEGVSNNQLRIATVGIEGASTVATAAIGELSGLYSAENVYDNLVSYDGASEAIQGIVRGDAHYRAGSYESLIQYVESADLRMTLAMSTDEEPPESTPDAETLVSAEPEIENASGIAGLSGVQRIFCGPPEVPDEQMTILREAFSSAIQNEGLKAEARDAGRRVQFADSNSVEEKIQGAFDSVDLYSEVLEVAEQKASGQ